MISLTHTRYGSRDRRQGRSRACSAYQANSRRRSDLLLGRREMAAHVSRCDLRSVAVLMRRISHAKARAQRADSEAAIAVNRNSDNYHRIPIASNFSFCALRLCVRHDWRNRHQAVAIATNQPKGNSSTIRRRRPAGGQIAASRGGPGSGGDGDDQDGEDVLHDAELADGSQ